MGPSVSPIPVANLALGFLPAALVIVILWRWSLGTRASLLALVRMLIQLLLVGYVLTFIFNAHHAAIIIAVLAVMLLASSWIALNPVRARRRPLYFRALIAISAGGVSTLALTTAGVLELSPWFAPRYMVPLAGMVFANAMNTVSLAAERFEAERERGVDQGQARDSAFRAAMIPMINSLLAVGIVSLPGMMTGQILSGVSPVIAAQYQIMVMCMVFGSAGISAACFLMLMTRNEEQEPP